MHRKILIVDDEPIVRDVLLEFLTLLHFQTENAGDGKSGLLALQKTSYGAAFADIRMPGMDGIEFLKNSRRIRPDLPVIIITGHGCDQTRKEAMDAGAFAYLRKPFRFHHIRDIMGRLFT